MSQPRTLTVIEASLKDFLEYDNQLPKYRPKFLDFFALLDVTATGQEFLSENRASEALNFFFF